MFVKLTFVWEAKDSSITSCFINISQLMLQRRGAIPLKLNSGSFYLPHPAKAKTGGEDAHFVCILTPAICAADGVGGWAGLGIDAGLYARELMSHSSTAILDEPKGSVNLIRAGERAYVRAKAKDELFDNLYDEDISGVVFQAMEAGLGPQMTYEQWIILSHHLSLMELARLDLGTTMGNWTTSL
ncbi:hypothetical protein P3S68_005413 [Capsicum galapagoense]